MDHFITTFTNRQTSTENDENKVDCEGHLRLGSGDYQAVTTTTGTTGDVLSLAFVNSSLGTKQLHTANHG